MESLYALPLMVKAVILGIVEGLTEFLPISSTGHLILTSSLLGWDDEKASVFAIAIQTGAILAVIWYYRERIGKVLAGLTSDRVQQRFALNIIIAFIPAAVLGVLFSKLIKTYLFGPVPVAIALVVGGLIIFLVEKRQENIKPRITDIDSLTAGLRAHPGHQPFRFHHHRRHDLRPVASGGHRVLLLPGHPHAHRRQRL